VALGEREGLEPLAVDNDDVVKQLPRRVITAPSLLTDGVSSHPTAPGIYLKLAKKSSEISCITASDAVEVVALCFG
jgi:hypothetical protein